MFLSYMVCVRSSCDVSVAVLVVGSSWSTLYLFSLVSMDFYYFYFFEKKKKEEKKNIPSIRTILLYMLSFIYAS